MKVSRLIAIGALAFAGLALRAAAQARAQSASSQVPTPNWVQVIDQGEIDPQLKGLKTPRGVKLQIVSEGPYLANTAAIAFDDRSQLYLLQAAPTPRLVVLQPRANDAGYDSASVLMDDLELPAGLLLHDGWIYWTSRGRILRRRPNDAALLNQLQTAADAKKGPATKVTSDGKWIEQQLVHGLSPLPIQVTALALGPDGWLYAATGSGDHRAESWDGARAVVLRTGAIFRMRPDGSRLRELARGFARPSGGLAFDELGNAFCAGDSIPGVDVPTVRLIHVLTSGDYGWRHSPAAKNAESDESALSQPDPIRSAVRGERVGTLPAIFNDCPASSAVMYYGVTFPQHFQGLLIAANPEAHELIAFSLQRSGQTFELTSRFALLKSDDPQFRPALIAIGPDGAIYVAEGGSHGRLFRLSWGSDAQTPAISLASRDTWARVSSISEDELWTLLDSPDQVVRRRAADRLAIQARERLAGVMADATRPLTTRATALFTLAHHTDKATHDAVVRLLADENPDLACLAADAIGRSPPADQEELVASAESVKSILSRTRDPVIERALRLALGRLAKSVDDAEWGFESMSVTHRLNTSRYVFDAHVRALEMVPGAAKELMLGNLEVALIMPEVELQERQRLKEFVTLTAEAMRTRDVSDFLDALLAGEQDLFAMIEAPLQVRLLACYQNVLADPTIDADAIVRWITAHPGGPAEVEIAALESVLRVGLSRPHATAAFAERLFARQDIAMALARRILSRQLDQSLLSQVKEALRRHVEKDNSGRAASMLIELNKLAQ